MYGAEYLSLEDLLDQDPSAYEFFQTLSPEAKALLEEDGSVTSFARLQSKTAQMRRAGLMEGEKAAWVLTQAALPAVFSGPS